MNTPLQTSPSPQADGESAYTRMIRLLKSTGLYRLDGTTAVEKEIRLISAYFDQLEGKIIELTDDCFIDSVTRDGFDAYRMLYSLPETMDYAPLQSIVKLRAGITNRDFTRDGIKRCMASGGFETELTENFQNGSVTVKILSDAGAFGTRAESEAFLSQCLPCHLSASFLWG